MHGETLVNKECLRDYSGVSDERKLLEGLLVDGGFVHGETLVSKECLRAVWADFRVLGRFLFLSVSDPFGPFWPNFESFWVIF